jgi:anti-sigma regulatory factor (Ser/Thr protein kinase)
MLVMAEASQAAEARRMASTLARRLGFGPTEAGRIAIVVTEASTNLVKHAHGGEVLLGAVEAGSARGVCMIALDRGPGMPSMPNCMRDGFSTTGSPGTGLGAISRLASVFDLYSGKEGTALLAHVADPEPGGPLADGIVFGAVSIPKRGEEVCGDGWAVAETRAGAAILVVDGLGHGPSAADAAAIATRLFRSHSGSSPTEILERIHDGLRGSRGAAAAVAEIDRAHGLVRFAGIGNVSGVVHGGGTSRNMVSLHGTLGHEVRRIQEFTYAWPPGAVAVMHSDGLSSRWDLAAYPGLPDRHPMLAAGVLYRDFRRDRDDATVVVVREAA